MSLTKMTTPVTFPKGHRVLVDADNNPVLQVEMREDMKANQEIIRMSLNGVLKAAQHLKVDPMVVARVIEDGSFLALTFQTAVSTVPTMAEMMKELAAAFPGKRLEDLTEEEMRAALRTK